MFDAATRCGGPCEQGRKPCPTPDACTAMHRAGFLAGSTPAERELRAERSAGLSSAGTAPALLLVAVVCLLASLAALTLWLSA
jgi:hypothetical protein